MPHAGHNMFDSVSLIVHSLCQSHYVQVVLLSIEEGQILRLPLHA